MELVFKNVSKTYRNRKRAVEELDAVLHEGIYGMLGPNGAGKSTLMKMLVADMRPTGGEILLDGEDIFSMGKQYRGLLGYMPQQQELIPYFTGRKFLEYMAVLKAMPRKEIDEEIESLACKVNLQDVLDRRVGQYSGGMKQRLLIAQALLGDPRILVFDEPTAGLDPLERIRVRNLIAEHAEHRIVLIATHVVQDIEYIAEQILILKNGHLLENGTPEQLLCRVQGKLWEMTLPEAEAEQLLQKYNAVNVARVGNAVMMRVISDECPCGAAKEATPNIEDYYLDVFSEERL